LRPFHSKGGNNNLFPPRVTVVNRFGQFIQAVLFTFMIAVSVGRFHEKIICLTYGHGIFHQQLMSSSDISGKNQLCRRAVFRNKYFHNSRAQNMTGVLKVDFYSRSRTEHFIIFFCFDNRRNRFSVFCRIKRRDICRLSPALQSFYLPPRFRFLNMCAVQKQNFYQITGRLRYINWPPETLLHDQRQ